MKKKNDSNHLEKLAKLTKLIKEDKVSVEPKKFGRGPNKWRSKDPKYSPRSEKRADLVDVGGMLVDPSRQEEYNLWRQDKIAEQNERRQSSLRRLAARKKPTE